MSSGFYNLIAMAVISWLPLLGLGAQGHPCALFTDADFSRIRQHIAQADAAELLRDYEGWTAASQGAFKAWLRTV